MNGRLSMDAGSVNCIIDKYETDQNRSTFVTPLWGAMYLRLALVSANYVAKSGRDFRMFIYLKHAKV